MDLVYKNEKRLFAIAALISGIFWLLLIVGTIGIALIYLLLGYLFFLFAHSAFISHLKGTGVRITAQQYPDLHNSLIASCKKLGIEEIPEAYLLRTDFFNALATRFLGRNFLVLFTDVVDALEDRPEAVNFYIGHELGHIHRKHLLWSPFLFPASILPLLGTALRRAEEYTCDRYGVACCDSREDVQAALAAIAAGNSRWKGINADAYVAQVADTNGFWMSFNELTGDYPWLTKRMATAMGTINQQPVKLPRRHAFAWLLAMFVPRVGAGGMPSLLITIALIGILAAVALPAYKDYTDRARYAQAYQTALPVQQRAADYATQNQRWPEALTDLGYPTPTLNNAQQSFEVAIYENGVIGVEMGFDETGEGRYIVLEPAVDDTDGSLSWSCYGQNTLPKLLPQACR